jgi:voltage-gated potassium channel
MDSLMAIANGSSDAAWRSDRDILSRHHPSRQSVRAPIRRLMPPLFRLHRSLTPSTGTPDDHEFRRRLLRVALLLATVIVLGTAGYMLLEGWRLLDALYMTVITLSTVGFTEVHPLSDPGHLFTLALIVTGVSTAAYAVGAIGEYVIGGRLSGALRRQRMQHEIDRLEGHYIVCGYGRVGRQVVEELDARGTRTVVIEPGDDALPADGSGPLRIHGDATDDRALRTAGIGRAAGLVAAAGDDATNIVVTLSARALNAELLIVARAIQPEAEDKLRRAGATHVISPYRIGGQRIVTQLLHPRITDFLDVVMHRGNLELWLEEITVAADGPASGRTLGETAIWGADGVKVLAVGREDGQLVTSPRGEHRLAPGDVLIALGTLDQLEAARREAGDRERTTPAPADRVLRSPA